MEASLRKLLPSTGDYKIGFPSGIWVAPVHYNAEIWYSTYLIANKRSWNGFGRSSELGGNKSTSIIVEINTPLKGINRSVSGFFAIDDKSERIFLIHRGKIGGGKKGVGKSAFLRWHS